MPKGKKAKVKRIKAGTGRAAAIARRLAFAHAYITNGQNGTQAAITAGFAAKSANVTASRLLTDANTLKLIEDAAKEASKISGLTVERTLREVARIAYSDPRKLYTETGALKDMSELDDDCAAIVASVETEQSRIAGEDGEDGTVSQTKKLKLWDKNAALEKAMKFHGLYEKDNAQAPKPVHITMVFE